MVFDSWLLSLNLERLHPPKVTVWVSISNSFGNMYLPHTRDGVHAQEHELGIYKEHILSLETMVRWEVLFALGLQFF
jgi:hypothetical protein